MDVSIIIVNYNTKELTRNCLKSIYEHTYDIDFEVIVSDNGSVDGSIEMIKNEFPQVILIENNANLGFGAANNRGLKIANGKYVFYLNSDTVLLNNAVKIFFDYWENSSEKEKIGALGCILKDEYGNRIHSGDIFPRYKNEIIKLIKTNASIRINSFLAKLHFCQVHSKKSVIKKDCFPSIEYVTGADLFLLNNDFAIFDESYFLYFEETDLQYRMSKNNLNRILISGPEIVHLTGKSNNVEKNEILRYVSFSLCQVLVSRIIYFKKNYYRKIPLFFVYLLTQFYLSHFYFLHEIKNLRKKIYEIYHN